MEKISESKKHSSLVVMVVGSSPNTGLTIFTFVVKIVLFA